ncbi:MAG TPA: Fe(3+) ABC transporter substrate-binding protein [Parvularcula sp.]|nr:Fe(3+) ABC transporter substrate-binding protein [Parvularcula sp.]HBS31387.1 Fe(3+) ABC transporter substrate-binding protein [Parvularcula sp.]HBS36177.1 Fe(3+) ABC transporter substrate-binding protein [Parvularcula sp.]
MRCFAAVAALMLVAACSQKSAAPAEPSPAAQAGEVNIYSGRHYDSDLAIFDAFTAETGIKVNVIEAAGDALIERLALEGAASPADLFITADAGMLWRAKSRGVLRPIEDSAVLARAPAHFRDPEGEWVGISKRARVIIFNRGAGAPEGLDTYAGLADPSLHGMICVRSSTNLYNQSLLAAIIAHEGRDAALAWANGVVANFARPPEGDDTAQIEAVAAGLCRVGIVNSYYIGRYLDPADAKKFAIGEKIGVIFPDQEAAGTHVNVSGAGVVRHAKNAANAEKLLGYLLREAVQEEFARGNNEYPVVAGAAVSGPIATFGVFREDDLPMAALGEHQAEAVKIFDEAGWR